MKTKYHFRQIVRCTKNRVGRIVEITLFRRTNSIGYGIKGKDNRVFYVAQSEVLDKVA